jgi:uncharacterized membrane protein
MEARLIGRLRTLHGLVARQALYPVLLSSLLAVSLFGGRVYRSHTLVYLFLLWNLLLAWIPCFSSLWAERVYQRCPHRWWYLVIPGGLWLAFFPNAPYIVTDFSHLQERPPIPMWYDIGMLSAFALTGLFLAVLSLHTMQRIVRRYIGSILGWLFVAVTLGLGGFGVYLGRFLRWNSWDLFLHPRGVLGDVAVRLADPMSHPRTFGVTFLFAAILFVCYLALTTRERA